MQLLSNYGIIKNESRSITELRRYIPDLKTMSDEQVCKEVTKKAMELSQCRYFTFDYIEMNENEDGKDVLWVDTGYVDILKRPVYVQFTFSAQESDWIGAYVGTEDSIIAYQREYRIEKKGINSITKGSLLDVADDYLDKGSCNNSLSTILSTMKIEYEAAENKQESKESVEKVQVNEADVVSISAKSDFIKQLYSMLMVPNSWDIYSLASYLDCCISRINRLVVKDGVKDVFVVYNADKSKALMNSGLLDRYGKTILLVTSTDKITKSVSHLNRENVQIAQGKADLVALGFNKDELNLNIVRVPFYNESSKELVFTADIDDFDLESYYRLEHCIEERRDRFPEAYADLTDDFIYSDVIKAIKIGLELNKCDMNYIKPMYNKRNDCINFIIPYHVAGNFQKKPDLGIVVAYINGYWQVMTLLDSQMCMNNIKVFNMYANESF